MFAWVQSLDSFFKQGKLRFLGLGFLLAWVYGSWFSDGIFPPGSSQAIDTLRISLAASAIGLFALAFRPNKRKPLSPTWILVSALVVSGTTFLFFFIPNGIALLAASALGGIASSVLWVAWGELFCEVDMDITESCIPASLGVFVVATALTYLLPTPISGIFAALFPLISCLMLLLCKNIQPAEFVFEAPIKPFSTVLPSLSKLAFCSMVCSIATGCVVTSFRPEDVFIPADGVILFYVAGGILAGIIAVIAIAHASRLNFSFLYEWAIPLVVISLSLRALDDPLFNTLAIVLACSAALYVEVLFFAIFARITAKGLCLPSETFGIFRAVVQLGFLVGALLGTYVLDAWGLPVFLSLICLCVVMLPLFIHLQKRFEGVNEGKRPLEASELVVSENARDLMGELAEAYKLSPRETEVLRYLGRGRSVPYIREAMTLSKSTIETHIKHIYAKTDAHSKQELIDLIESYEAKGS